MPISVDCSACGRHYTVIDEAAGRKFKCKDCGAVIDVPDAYAAAGHSFEGAADALASDLMQAPASEASQERRERLTERAAASAAERLKGPAVCLIVLGILALLLDIFNLLMQLARLGAAPGAHPGEITAQFAAFMIFVVFHAVTLMGGIKMLQLQSQSTARAGAICAIIPCCSPCLVIGIPFGIWALMVLNDPDVKRAFHS